MQKMDDAKPFDFNGDDARRILVFRSARLWQVEAAVSSLKDRFPNARIDILCQPSAKSETAKIAAVDNVIEFPAELFLVSKASPGMILKLRRRRYDLAVVIHNNIFGEDYRDAHVIASLTGARRLVSYNIEAEWTPIPGAVPGSLLKAAAWAICALAVYVVRAPFQSDMKSTKDKG